MNYCNFKKLEIENGPHCGCSLFVSGCRNHCKGCFQPETWDFNYGNAYTEEVEDLIILTLSDPNIKRISLLGGEVFEEENQPAILKLIQRIRSNELTKNKIIVCYTGYVLENDLKYGQQKYLDSVTQKILDNIDILIDGPFILELKDLTLQFRGSSNQRILYKGKDF